MSFVGKLDVLFTWRYWQFRIKIYYFCIFFTYFCLISWRFYFKNRQVMYTNKPCHESCGDRQLDNNGWSMAMEPPFSTSKWCRVKDCQDRSASVIHRRPSWWFPIPIDTCKKSKSKSRVFYLQVSHDMLEFKFFQLYE